MDDDDNPLDVLNKHWQVFDHGDHWVARLDNKVIRGDRTEALAALRDHLRAVLGEVEKELSDGNG